MISYLAIVIFIIAVTRAFAYWGIYFLKAGEIPVINGVLHLTYVENTGAAFGIFKNSTAMLSIVGIILFIIITYIVASRKNLGIYTKILLACLAGGGISNVCDRNSFGFVVDYINFCLIDYPVFNVADICVVVSCVLIAVKIIMTDSDKGREVNAVGNNDSN